MKKMREAKMMPLDDEILQRYHDGDLPRAEADQVRQRIESDPEARARLGQLQRLTALVRDAFAQASSEALGTPSKFALDADAMFARIESELAGTSTAPVQKSVLRAVPGKESAAKKRRNNVYPMFASMAVAAAALLVFLSPQVSREALSMIRGAEPAGTPPAAQLAPSGSQIDDVDFGGSTGTVFEIDNGGVSAAVVWISDDEEVQ